VKIEAAHGRDRNALIPITIAPANIPFAFRHLQSADLCAWQPAEPSVEYQEVLAAIESMAPRPRISQLDASPSESTPGKISTREPSLPTESAPARQAPRRADTSPAEPRSEQPAATPASPEPHESLAEAEPPAEEAALISEFIDFLKNASVRRYPTGTIRRFNQGRQTAFIQAEFTVPDGLPEAHRVGLFAIPRTYAAWIRFANADSESDRERDIRGMSIQVLNVDGENLTPGVNSQEFVLNSHPVMLAATTRDFLELLRANEAGGVRRVQYFLSHLASSRIAAVALQNHTCHLDIQYWSTTPYQFGPGRTVKYAVRPTSRRTSTMPHPLTDRYLTDAMRAHLDQEDATFDFLIQFHVDDQRTPIEDASVEWQPKDSPFHRVGIIRIPRQRFEDGDRVTRGERMTFNPWHCLVAHAPLGGMNRARREIYRAMADFRRSRVGPASGS
jgi:hypothetical protein